MIRGNEEQGPCEILHSKVLYIMTLLKILQSSCGFSLCFPHVYITHSYMRRSYLSETMKHYFYLFSKYHSETEAVQGIFA